VVAASQARPHLRFKQNVEAVPLCQAILVIDRTGEPLASSALSTISSDVTVADRAYFQTHRTGSEGTLVSGILRPRWARGIQNDFFNLSRRRAAPNGAFNGIISVAVRPEYFEEFYGLMGTGPGSLYALVRSDGQFLARYPVPLDRMRTLDPSSPLRVAIARGGERNLYTVPRSQIDGVERRIGNRKLTGFPVYVVAGMDVATIRTEWLTTMASYLIFGLPPTFLIFAILGLALQRTRRLHEEAERREAAEGELRQTQHLKAIGQLTRGLANDFNNLLMVIQGHAELASAELAAGHGRGPGALGEHLEQIGRAADSAAGLVRQLLDLGRTQADEPDATSPAPGLEQLPALVIDHFLEKG